MFVQGNDIMEALDMKGGKELTVVLDRIIRHQLECPGLSKEGAVAWLKDAWKLSGNNLSHFAELGVKRKREE